VSQQFATVARTEGGELQQLRALVGSTRKSSAFGLMAVGFLVSTLLHLCVGIGSSNGSRLRLRTYGGMLGKSDGGL
jgi:hypothetical protein